MKIEIQNTMKIIFIVFCVVGVSIYVGNMLFGVNSFEILYSINKDKSRLSVAIATLKKENAALQKEYFELRELDPDMRKNR